MRQELFNQPHGRLLSSAQASHTLTWVSWSLLLCWISLKFQTCFSEHYITSHGSIIFQTKPKQMLMKIHQQFWGRKSLAQKSTWLMQHNIKNTTETDLESGPVYSDNRWALLYIALHLFYIHFEFISFIFYIYLTAVVIVQIRHFYDRCRCRKRSNILSGILS